MFRLPESECHRLEASLSYEDCEVPPGVDSAKEQVAGYVGTREVYQVKEEDSFIRVEPRRRLRLYFETEFLFLSGKFYIF